MASSSSSRPAPSAADAALLRAAVEATQSEDISREEQERLIAATGILERL
jgi:hypothetical protein